MMKPLLHIVQITIFKYSYRRGSLVDKRLPTTPQIPFLHKYVAINLMTARTEHSQLTSIKCHQRLIDMDSQLTDYTYVELNG